LKEEKFKEIKEVSEQEEIEQVARFELENQATPPKKERIQAPSALSNKRAF
jgi:hypothetical protein